MKKIGGFLLSIVIGVWAIVGIFVTICLLSYNDFGVTEFGTRTLVIVDNDELEPLFKENDLLIVTRTSNRNINVGDMVFYYDSSMNSVAINMGKVQEKKDINKNVSTYTIDNMKISSEYVFGKADKAKVHHKIGLYLKVLTSQWGFMFLIIFPTLFAFIYEIIMIFETAKEKNGNE